MIQEWTHESDSRQLSSELSDLADLLYQKVGRVKHARNPKHVEAGLSEIETISDDIRRIAKRVRDD